MIQVNREHVKKVFHSYTDNYNSSDEKIRLKIVHTYHVADISEQIAKSLHLSFADVNLAWLIGILHDIGRFEQLRKYGTFEDAASVNHAQSGVDILFNQSLIRTFIQDNSEDELIKNAILVHNMYKIPEGYDNRTLQFIHLLRDADKIDILRVCSETPVEDIYDVSTDSVIHSDVSPAVMESFMENHAVEHKLKQTPPDHIAGHASLVFELVYPESIRIVKEQGNLKKLLHFKTENQRTASDFAKMEERLNSYIENALA